MINVVSLNRLVTATTYDTGRQLRRAALLLPFALAASLLTGAQAQDGLPLRGLEPNQSTSGNATANPASPLPESTAPSVKQAAPSQVSPVSSSAGWFAPAAPAAQLPAQPKPLSAIVGRDIDFDIKPGSAPSKEMRALRVKVHNRSDEPLIFDGDRSSLVASSNLASAVAHCISQNELDAVGRPPTTFKGKFASDLAAVATAAPSVGIVQTLETIKIEHGPIAGRYEWDEARRTHEESRFGRRLVYPGDSTDGNIYFSADTPFEGRLLSIPVKSFYDNSDQAAVTKLIESSN